jgi:hypothetical protein
VSRSAAIATKAERIRSCARSTSRPGQSIALAIQRRIHTALDLERQDGSVIADRIGETDCIFLAGLHGAERAVAERLRNRDALRIPYGSKNVAMKLGARYGSAGWYARPGADLSGFGERGWL